METHHTKLQTGLVFFFAITLSRRCANHDSIMEAVQWLDSNGCEYYAEELLKIVNENSSALVT